MRFEEVLPKMRDEGRIAVRNGQEYKFFDGNLMFKANHEWVYITLTSQAYITNDWTLEPIKVKKWQWVFGVENRANFLTQSRMTKQEAYDYAKGHNFNWAIYIDQTLTEEEE